MESLIRISAPLWALFLMVACLLSAAIFQSKNHVLGQNSKESALKIKEWHHAKAWNTKRHLDELSVDDVAFDLLTDLLGDEIFAKCTVLTVETDDRSLYDQANWKFTDTQETVAVSLDGHYTLFDYPETARAELEATCDELGGHFITQEAVILCIGQTERTEYGGNAACLPDIEPCRNFDFDAALAFASSNAYGEECEVVGAVEDDFDDSLEYGQDANYTQCHVLMRESHDFSLYDDANSKYFDTQTVTINEEELYELHEFDQTARAELEATCDEELGGYFRTLEAPILCNVTGNEMRLVEYSGTSVCFPPFEQCRNLDFTTGSAFFYEMGLYGAECKAAAAPEEDFAVLVTAPPSPQSTFEDKNVTTVTTSLAAPDDLLGELNYVRSNIRRPSSTRLPPMSF